MTELAPGGGLSIVHFGREAFLLARQLLVLDHGAYAIVSEFSGSLEPDRIEWRIQCLDGSQAQVMPAGPQARTFRIGAGCPGAWLDLYAVPSESQARLDAVLRKVEVKRIG